VFAMTTKHQTNHRHYEKHSDAVISMSQPNSKIASLCVHKQEKSVKVAQKILVHANAATTLIYEDPPEEKIADALGNL